MIKLGLIENPASDRNRRAPSGFAAQVKGKADILYERLEDVDALPAILESFARQDIGLIAVAAGDGTIQAVLTALYRGKAFAQPPPLALLARGRTNLIPGDVGFGKGDRKALARLIALAAEQDARPLLATRALLQVAGMAEAPPQLGMFLAGAGIYRAIEACMEKVNPTGLPPGLANFLTMSGLIVRWLLRGRQSDAVFHGDRVTLSVDGAPGQEQATLLFFITTLERLIFGTRPYWGNDAGALRYTTIAYPPRKLVRSLPRLFFGGKERGLDPQSYASGSAERIELRMSCPFMLDGQAFHPPQDGPLVVRSAGRARFVVA